MSVISLATSFFSCVAEFVIFYQYFSNFFKRKQITTRQWCLITLLMCCLLTLINCMHIATLNTAAIFILLLIYTQMLFIGKIFTRFIFSIAIVGVGILSEFATGFGVSALINIQLSDTIAQPYLLFIIMVLSKMMLFFATRLVIFLAPRKYQGESGKNLFGAILFPVFCIANMYLLMYLQGDRPASKIELTITLVVAVGLLVSCIAIFMVYDDSMQKRELENRIKLAEHREDANNLFYKQQERNTEETKRLLHDFKNQIISLDILYRQGDASAEEYSTKLLRTLDEQMRAEPIGVKNAVVSNILINTKNKCAAKGILFKTEIGCNDLSFLEYMDANSILGNALDNAMTACEQQPPTAHRFIAVKIYPVSSFLVIKVQNSKSNQIVTEGGEIVTTESDASQHGFGLKNIRRAAQKYSGDISCKYDNESFTLVIRLERALQ